MAHKHSVYDSDLHFAINPTTRTITNMSSQKTTLVQHDHNSERFTFEIPRYVEGHDMSICNVVEIHYLNIDAVNKERYEGVYGVTDLQVSPEDEDVVICSWLISQNATKLVGSLNFLVRFACVTNSMVDYAWNTTIFSGIAVSSGIYNGEVIVEQYADVLNTWYEELINAGNAGVNAIADAQNKALDEIEEKSAVIVEEVAKSVTVETIAPHVEEAVGELVDNLTEMQYSVDDDGVLILDKAFAPDSGEIPADLDKYFVDGSLLVGENTKCYFPGSTAFGSDTVAGGKYFIVDSYSVETNGDTTYYTFKLANYPDLEKDFSALQVIASDVIADGNDYTDVYISVRATYNFDFVGFIEHPSHISPTNKTIKFKFTHTSVGKFNSYLLNTQGEIILWIPGHPELGSELLQYPSHAEGMGSFAQNISAHAEGENTIAAGRFSHTEGVETKAGYASHAEGKLTMARGDQSHAEGYNSKASGDTSHAEGLSTVADGGASHTEGGFTKAVGTYAHAEGQSTTANGVASHAEGERNTANGNASHVGGFISVADGNYSFVHGIGLKSTKENQVVLGKYNEDSDALFVIGSGTGASDDARHNVVEVFPDNLTRMDFLEVNSTKAQNICIKGFKIDGASSNKSDPWYVITPGNNLKAEMKNIINTGASLTAVVLTKSGEIIQGKVWSTWSHALDYFQLGFKIPSDKFVSDAVSVFFLEYPTFGNIRLCRNNAFVGEGLQLLSDNAVAIGSYNNPDFGTLFSIGNGTDNEHRSNALAVFEDGHVEVQKQGESENSVVTLGYLLEKINELKSMLGG